MALDSEMRQRRVERMWLREKERRIRTGSLVVPQLVWRLARRLACSLIAGGSKSPLEKVNDEYKELEKRIIIEQQQEEEILDDIFLTDFREMKDRYKIMLDDLLND